MPIRIQNNLPATETLEREHIFVMPEDRAFRQDIRPIRILILNLMPNKIATETQLLRVLSNSPLQVDVDLMYTSSYLPKNTSIDHLIKFYETFDDIRERYYDGMIITGAPVEHMPFEEVDYWEELTEIMRWSKSHVYSTLHICWGAQAGLYYHFGIPKFDMPKKIFGIFPHSMTYTKPVKLFRGFDDVFFIPHSRHTEIRKQDLICHDELRILSESRECGVYAVSDLTGRQIFITGHSEYDVGTLRDEYVRDLNKGLSINMPKNYFPDDDPSREPVMRWRSSATLLFTNWLNYYVYQETPFDLTEISSADMNSRQGVDAHVEEKGNGSNCATNGKQGGR
ncbi:MAG: homoserine O-succinyltransferase [Clostridiaceae bacterium]|nr:homoserine O-succinyltransferase [Clostridiaceae bacterium]